MSFLSNFNTLVEILLSATDLLESNEDMIYFCFATETYKKGNISSIFKKIRKMLV